MASRRCGEDQPFEKENHLMQTSIFGFQNFEFSRVFPSKSSNHSFSKGRACWFVSFFFVVPPNMVVSYTWTAPLLRFSPQGFKCKSALKVLNLSSQEAPPACSCQVTSRASSGAGPGSHLRLMVAALRSKHRPRRRESVSQIPMKDLGGVFLK